MTELLEQAKNGVITPAVEVVDMSRVPGVMERLTRGEIAGRVVVSLPS